MRRDNLWVMIAVSLAGCFTAGGDLAVVTPSDEATRALAC
jgi:hypothetical protein